MIRILAMGSRYYSHPDVVRLALEGAEERAAGQRLILAHGKCDPRDPVTRARLRWENIAQLAERRPPGYARGFLGADWLADVIARELGWQTDPLPADWSTYGKQAGPIRNGWLVERGADEALAFFQPGEANSGTRDCAKKCEEAGIKVRPF